MKRERWIRSQETRIRAEARALGVKDPDGKNLWDVLGRLNDARDELSRPELEARAKALGVRTHNWFGGKRWFTDLSLAVYDAEERKRLSREMGIDC